VLLTAAALTLGLTAAALPAISDLRAVAPTTATAATSTVLRVATFNVRTARAVQDQRSWLTRAPSVAAEILSRRPGVVALQELGPGRADGQLGPLGSSERQTTSLTSALSARGGGRYRLVRTTSYTAPGTVHNTQGTRILYDSSRYALTSGCPETTGNRAYNFSCAFDLPLAAGDSEKQRRAAAYAQFRDLRTGRQFFVASAHLDSRHSASATREAVFNQLRARQASWVVRTVAKANPGRLPIVFGGDINSWQTDRGRYAPHRALAAAGFRDATSARLRHNFAYPTINHFRTTMKRSKSRQGGVRLDVVMVKGGKGFTRYENKLRRVDASRPSDHNLVVADVRI
jgi:endonuclease/exonuclease/phosphatase family metal-dependent hydrolase